MDERETFSSRGPSSRHPLPLIIQWPFHRHPPVKPANLLKLIDLAPHPDGQGHRPEAPDTSGQPERKTGAQMAGTPERKPSLPAVEL